MFECPVCGETMTQWASVALTFEIMQHYQSDPIQPRLPHPKCPKCGATMYLSEIQDDDEPDHDRRKFECIECGSDLVEVVKYK